MFRDGKVFCYLASVGHWHDVGGNVPGNYNPVATESFQEGFLMPPVKLFEAGRLRQDIVDILQANSRLPGSLYGDLNGQINALDLGVKRLGALLDHYGDETVRLAFDRELKARAAALMRSADPGPSGWRLPRPTIISTMTASWMRRFRLICRYRSAGPDDVGLLRIGARLRRPGEHCAIDNRRCLLCRDEACLPGRPCQCGVLEPIDAS